jgi:hypothetical protein
MLNIQWVFGCVGFEVLAAGLLMMILQVHIVLLGT